MHNIIMESIATAKTHSLHFIDKEKKKMSKYERRRENFVYNYNW